ncbi:hypothetical protein N9Y92_01725 [Chlamydiales bacterium]|nr:hypothetical protein [Chlamydiales bacterium]
MRSVKIPKVLKKCIKEGCSFKDEMPYFSRITFGKEGVEREDFCERCWEKPENALWWQGVYTVNEVLFNELTPYEEDLFKSFLKAYEDLENCLEFTHFLAQYFKRRKLFIKRGECHIDEVLSEIYEVKGGRDSFIIPKRIITLKELDFIRCQLNG